MPISLFRRYSGKTRITQNSTLLLLPVPDNSASQSYLGFCDAQWLFSLFLNEFTEGAVTREKGRLFQGVAPTLRRCQPAPDGAVVAVRRRPAACPRMNDFLRRKRLHALSDWLHTAEYTLIIVVNYVVIGYFREVIFFIGAVLTYKTYWVKVDGKITSMPLLFDLSWTSVTSLLFIQRNFHLHIGPLK